MRWKDVLFSPKISLQTACSIDTDALTSWFSLHDSCLPSYVAQYEPVSCIPALWSIKSLSQLESGQIIKWLVHFSITCRWHRVYTMEPMPGLQCLGRYHSFRKVRTIQSHSESRVCQRDKAQLPLMRHGIPENVICEFLGSLKKI